LVSGITSRCGDGKVASPETCDDGNRNPGDGCNSNCGIEPGFTCNNNQQPSSCGKNIDVCFDGIDNNANGVVDENCGGCADYNSDNKVDFDDSVEDYGNMLTRVINLSRERNATLIFTTQPYLWKENMSEKEDRLFGNVFQ